MQLDEYMAENENSKLVGPYAWVHPLWTKLCQYPLTKKISVQTATTHIVWGRADPGGPRSWYNEHSPPDKRMSPSAVVITAFFWEKADLESLGVFPLMHNPLFYSASLKEYCYYGRNPNFRNETYIASMRARHAEQMKRLKERQDAQLPK